MLYIISSADVNVRCKMLRIVFSMRLHDISQVRSGSAIVRRHAAPTSFAIFYKRPDARTVIDEPFSYTKNNPACGCCGYHGLGFTTYRTATLLDGNHPQHRGVTVRPSNGVDAPNLNGYEYFSTTADCCSSRPLTLSPGGCLTGFSIL